MNMEDRLREAFQDEAQHLQAPSGSPETAIRRGRTRRASNLIGGAALVFALLGGTAVGVQVLGDASPTSGDDDTTAAELTRAAADEQGGDGVVAPAAPEIEFRWQHVTLEAPEGVHIWTAEVAATDDGFVAVANGETGQGRGGLFTWTSSDGRDWSLVNTVGEFDAPVEEVHSTGDGFIAVARSYDGTSSTTSLYVSSDGVNWTRGTVELGPNEPDTHSWFTGAAAGNGTWVLAGATQTEPPQPPIVFEEWGIALQRDVYGGSFDVVDLASGDVITTIPMDAVYGGGQAAVYDADGTFLFEIPDGMLEDGFLAGGSGGFAVAGVDGYEIEFDFESDSYTATDEATGEVVAEGDLDELYQRPYTVITDPATGETLLDITLEEFFRAEDRSWAERSEEFFPETTAFMLVSGDGVTWEFVTIPTSQQAAHGIDVSGVTYGPEGFLVSINRYGPESSSAEVLRSSDGRNWDSLDGSDEPRNGPIVAWDGDLYSLAWSSRGASSVATSTDAVSWTPVYESPGRGTHLHTIAAGDLGVVALGNSQDITFGPPLTISKDGRTLVLDQERGTFTVTDSATGEVLTEVAFDVFDEEAPDQIVIDEDTEALTIFDEDGTALMTVTEEEGAAAQAELEEQYGDISESASLPVPAVAYSPDGAEWFTVSTAGLDMAWTRSVAVGRDALIVVGESAGAYFEEAAPPDAEWSVTVEGEETITTSVGAGTPLRVHLWVGTAS